MFAQGHQTAHESENKTRSDINNILWDKENEGVHLARNRNREFGILTLVLIFTGRPVDKTVVDDTRTKGVEQVKEEDRIRNGRVFETSDGRGGFRFIG